MNNYIREPINGLTHLAGAILSFAALLAMVIKASLTTGSALAITAVTIFGISMILLYSASATYHMVIAKDKVIAFLRRLDHSMIFILIAGSYTPFCLISLNGTTGWVLFSIVTAIALFGILFKMIWFNCPRWLSTALYIAMGWMVIFVFSPLTSSLNANGLLLLVLGGVFYTIGGIIYAVKPKFLEFKHMGFHEIFHIFIMLGSLAHFLCVFLFVI
ncbi:MAG: hemolysin III family protein [Ectobacillus sp.]